MEIYGKGEPRTGDGRTGGEKPARYNITRRTASDVLLPTRLFGGKPKPAKPAASPKAAASPKPRHEWFG